MLFRCCSVDFAPPPSYERDVSCVATFEDITDYYVLRHWSIPFPIMCDGARVRLLFERPDNDKWPTRFTLRGITVTLPDPERYCIESSPPGTISFHLNLPRRHRVHITKDEPLAVFMRDWEVAMPKSRYATVHPRSFVMNRVGYIPKNRHPVYGSYEDLTLTSA